MNGNFLGRCTCECYDEGTYTVMFYDESDRRIDTRVFDEEDYMYIAYYALCICIFKNHNINRKTQKK